MRGNHRIASANVDVRFIRVWVKRAAEAGAGVPEDEDCRDAAGDARRIRFTQWGRARGLQTAVE